MADLKALEAYAGYFYYLSKIWSKPLPEVYDPQYVDDYFGCRPHLVAFRLLEVVENDVLSLINLFLIQMHDVLEVWLFSLTQGSC